MASIRTAAWNIFRNKDPVESISLGPSVLYNPGPTVNRYSGVGIDGDLTTAIINRMSTDASAVRLEHVKIDQNGGFIERVDDGIGECLVWEANIDQSGRDFVFDMVYSMLEDGAVAAVPIKADNWPNDYGSFDVLEIRVGKIVDGKAQHVQVDLYNERSGIKEQIWVPKRHCAILTNPFYMVMNHSNSTLRRLTDKLALLDVIDKQSGSGKLDLIIQQPYAIKSKIQREKATAEIQDLEERLANSKLGIGFVDSTQKVIQLNRSVENNLMSQVEYLTSMLYSRLGVTPEILNGTATEGTMQNYYTRTIDVLLNTICDEFERKFLTKTARTQGHAFRYYRDPFSLTPSSAMPDIVDKLSRNEVLSPNELRTSMGYPPSTDPSADELRNRNLYGPEEALPVDPAGLGGDTSLDGGLNEV